MARLTSRRHRPSMAHTIITMTITRCTTVTRLRHLLLTLASAALRHRRLRSCRQVLQAHALSSILLRHSTCNMAAVVIDLRVLGASMEDGANADSSTMIGSALTVWANVEANTTGTCDGPGWI